ncbi:MAG: hypothetical protein O3C13_07865 [Bacteroidetes bacterium]|nr:hypothetical protein [Bacteroidota bacterium]
MYEYERKEGFYFNVEHIKGDMAFFYDFNTKPDTLCIKHLKEYHFSDMEEINIKEWEYNKQRFGGGPPISNKNWVFHTYLIEVISKKQFVIYPVIWRNEGVID